MFESQKLVAKSAPYRVLSPWFPRGGDNVTLTLDLVELYGNPRLTVRAFTKNSEDPGDGTDADSVTPTMIAAGSPGQVSASWEGKVGELVRYEFEIEHEDVTGAPGDWVLFRMLPPVWFDDVHQA